jgi:hypothetical protein
MQQVVFYLAILGGIASVYNIISLIWKRYKKNIRTIETPVNTLVIYYLLVLLLAIFYVFYRK